MSKKRLLFVMALIVAAAGCNKSGKLSEPSKSSTPPAGPVELTVKWPQGQRIVRNIEIKMTMDIPVPNVPQPIKQDTELGEEYGLTVLKEKAETGGPEIELEFQSIRIAVRQNAKALLDYDSEKKPEPNRVAALAAIEKVFHNIIGAKLQYYLDSSNDVARIDGLDQLKQRIMTSGGAQAMASLQGMFNEGNLKQMVESSRYMPGKPVKPGDSWPIQVEIDQGPQAGGILSMNYTITFQNWEKHGERTCARLEFSGTMKSKADASGSAASGMTIQDGASSGTSWFDPELGLNIDSTIGQDMTMKITIPASNRKKTPAQTISMTMHQDLRVKLDSVK